MKKIRILVSIIFVISCIVFGVYTVRDRVTRDVNAPEIYFEENEILVSMEATEDELLRGLSAIDKEDGDLSEFVQIASISRMMSGGKRTVKYVVFDKANNLGSAERTIVYEDYRLPRIYIKNPLRLSLNSEGRLVGGMEIIAEDKLDGDLTEKIEEIQVEPLSDAVGVYPMRLEVQNSLGDRRSVTVDVTVFDSTDTTEQNRYYPVLSDYVLYTKTNSPLDFRTYVTGIASMNERFVFGAADTPANITLDKVEIDSSAVDFSSPGEYRVYCSYTTRGGITGTTTAYVVVEGE